MSWAIIKSTQITKSALGYGLHYQQFRNVKVLQPLNLPPYPFKITDRNGNFFLFDEIRKKEILVTPEEWVRQHFIQFLINQKGYPKSLIKVEGGLKLHGMQRRSDILLHDNTGQKIMLVECKAPAIAVNQKVFDQAANYNMVHKVPLLVVTNGLTTYQAQIDIIEKTYKFLEELPFYTLSLGNR